MGLVQGFNHVAVITGDLDRMAGFYTAVFDATLVQVEDTPVGRFGVVRLGAGVAVNLFEIAGNDHIAGRPTTFDRGHVDHFGIDVTDEASFSELRDRLVAGGHSTGEITDFGPILGLSFTDPDGMACEVNLVLDPTLAGGHPPARYDEPITARRADHGNGALITPAWPGSPHGASDQAAPAQRSSRTARTLDNHEEVEPMPATTGIHHVAIKPLQQRSPEEHEDV